MQPDSRATNFDSCVKTWIHPVQRLTIFALYQTKTLTTRRKRRDNTAVPIEFGRQMRRPRRSRGGKSRRRFGAGQGPGGGRGRGICHQWRDTGFCRFGMSCKFKHVGTPGNGATGSHQIASSTSRISRSNEGMSRFIKHLSIVSTDKLDQKLLASSSLWRCCWQEQRLFDPATRRMMLEILARTPGSSSIDPPPIELCEAVVFAFLNENLASDTTILTSVKTTLDAVTRLLLFEWDCSRDKVVEGLSKIIELAEAKLRKRDKEHRHVASRCMVVLEDLEKPWRVKIKDVPNADLDLPSDTLVSCGHSRNVSCRDFLTENPMAAQCDTQGVYEASCGQKKKMKCWEIEEYTSTTKVFDCRESVSAILPPCCHRFNLLCGVDQSLSQRNGRSCERIGEICEGVTYGSRDYFCNKQATIVRKCGHNIKLPCSQTFARVTDLKTSQVQMLHPAFGYRCLLPCCSVSSAAAEVMTSPAATTEYQEENLPAPSADFALPKCPQSVYLCKCEHSSRIRFPDARVPHIGCEELVTVVSPLCGHRVHVEFSLAVEFQIAVSPIEIFDPLCSDGSLHRTATSQRDLSGADTRVLSSFQKWDKQARNILHCGHEKIVSCQDFVTWLIYVRDQTTSRQKCDEAVIKHLRCGHEIETMCSRAQRREAGQEVSVLPQKCWNSLKCRQNLQAECHFVGVAGRSTVAPWTCSAGYRFNINQCTDRTPVNRPKCSPSSLDAALQNSKKIDSSDLSTFIKSLPECCVERTEDDRNDFVRRELKLLSQYKLLDSSIAEWKRPHFSLQRIPCFRHLRDSNQHAKSFDQLKFVDDASMHGIMTTPLSEKNLNELARTAKTETFTLLFGLVSVVRTDARQSKTPRKKKRRATLQSVLDKHYDSMLFGDGGFTKLIIWDPFPALALFRVTISKDQLLLAVESVGGAFKTLDLQPKSILLSGPPEGIVAGNPAYETEDEDEETRSSLTNVERAMEGILVNTTLNGLRVHLDWPGGIHSGGVLQPNIERDLEEKMQFLNKEAPPFQAISLLKKVIASAEGEVPPLLHLLMSAEMSNHDRNRAKCHLASFVQASKSYGPSHRVHPWSLIIAARLDSTNSERLLSSFASSFPMQTHLLLESEHRAINGEQSETSVNEGWPETSTREWQDLQERYPSETESKAMDELLSLTGLRTIKQEAIRLWNSALQLKKMDPEVRKSNQVSANYIFAGNPGTGKTSVARLFARILYDSGVRNENVIEELTAQKAKDGGMYDFRKSVTKAEDGVLFIDEASTLDPIDDSKGEKIVNELLTLCENKRNEISVILAGFEDDFETKFFAYNDGLRSRFRLCVFEDFDEEELRTIWNDLRVQKRWKEDEGVSKILAKRLVKNAGRKGFGNAREVRKCLEEATQAAMTRLGDDFSMERMKIEIQDVIGQDPRLFNEKLKRVRDEIDQKIGWKRVKNLVGELINLCGVNYKRELMGKPPLDIFLNRMFLGNPGTGKTTCAKLYGRLLKELGFLSNGAVVTKSASDFIAKYTGQTQAKTAEILEGARGKVLIIDEAYALDDGMYGNQVLDTLVEKVQGGPSDDIAVLLLGYEEQMLAMIRNQNPGLARRFPNDHAFYFDDYNDNELLKIVKLNLKTNAVEASVEFSEKALNVLRQQRSQANFGNAGAAELVVKDAILKATKRLGDSSGILTLEDIDIDDPGTARAEKDEDPLKLLDSLFRMDKVKEQLENMRKTWAIATSDGDDQPSLGHFVFTGSPGTGKTTVARTIARVLFGLGLLPSDKIVETSGLDMTGEYVGQTKTKVVEALSEAKGGVLFIDEAYNLGIGRFGKEACDSLVAAMTSEKFRDVVIVIAGYTDEIDAMLNRNAGLKSRFTNFFQFPDWTAHDCRLFFDMLADKKKFTLDDGVLEVVERRCNELRSYPGFGNGRDVTKLWDQTKAARDVRVYESGSIEKHIFLEDFENATKEMTAARRPKSLHAPNKKLFNDPYGGVSLEGKSAPKSQQNVHQDQENGTEEVEEPTSIAGVKEDEKETIVPEDTTRDPGVSDKVWEELQQAKYQERERVAQLKREEEAYRHFLIEQEQKELEAKKRYEEKLQCVRRELEREEQERSIREAEEAERKRKHLEEERRRREEETRKRVETMERLQTIRPCPMGFSWFRQGQGWRCAGGSHFVSDSELKESFGCG